MVMASSDRRTAIINFSGKGGLTWKTKEFQATLEKHNFNLAEAFMDIYQKLLKEFETGGDKLGTLAVLAKLTKDIAEFSQPRLKAIDPPKDNKMDRLNDAEKLEVMRNAVKVLEQRVADDATLVKDNKLGGE
jgi:hypothetical protein